MKEHAERSTRTGVRPPTKTELATAATRGFLNRDGSLTGSKLAQLRTEARASKANKPVATASTAPTSTATYKAKIQQQAKVIATLQTKIAKLQVAVMTSK